MPDSKPLKAENSPDDWRLHYHCPHCGKVCYPPDAEVLHKCRHCGLPIHMPWEGEKDLG